MSDSENPIESEAVAISLTGQKNVKKGQLKSKKRINRSKQSDESTKLNNELDESVRLLDSELVLVKSEPELLTETKKTLEEPELLQSNKRDKIKELNKIILECFNLNYSTEVFNPIEELFTSISKLNQVWQTIGYKNNTN